MAAVAIPFLLMVSRGLDAQVVTPPSHELRWIVAGDAAADLWFYSLGTLGIDGPGTLPYYDARYARTVAATKARQGVGPSKLDRDAFRLRQAMASDSAFEVLHFLPLYFGRMEPKELPRRLRRTVASTPAAPAADDVTQAVRSALASRIQRAVVADLADAIEDEWRTFFGGYAMAHREADVRRRNALQERWDEAFAPRLAPVFRAAGLSSGVLLVSPSLGPEGRVVKFGSASAIIAVSDWRDAAPTDAPLLASIRELCFPLLERLAEIDATVRQHAPRSADESSRAAVRCGAQVVDALLPSLSADYRALFLSARPRESAADYRRRFDQRFQTDVSTLRAVSQEVARLASRPERPVP